MDHIIEKCQEYMNAHIWRERDGERRKRRRGKGTETEVVEKSGILQRKKIVGREWNIEIHTF